jgi:hypothetical protein
MGSGPSCSRECVRVTAWLGDAVSDFVCEPHAAVASDVREQEVLNFVANESAGARAAAAQFAREEPHRVNREIAKMITLQLPTRHWVDIEKDINPTHLRKVLLETYERAPADFEELLALKGVGPKAMRALALVAEVVYGSPVSMRDPARFSFAHGGKDGHPYPVDRPTYDHSIEYLREAIAKAKIGVSDRTDALKRLAGFKE